MPSPVDKYFEEVKKDNPSYSDEQAWATAWSIYCKYKNPGSEHCQKPPSEYLKGVQAGLESHKDANMSLKKAAQEFQDAVTVGMVSERFAKDFPTPKALQDYLHDHPSADKSKHRVVDEETAKLKKDLKDFDKHQKSREQSKLKKEKKQDNDQADKLKKELEAWRDAK